ncbi:uridine kinase [Cellulomonas chitinilytica]|uniref:uridine kinase n=1 Tax=Cellulomonas chitinilytica TaxID=398759 RepID=UPI0019459F6E|nr:uridine kinase [Cellulomonas chitinilytica]
MPVPVPTPVSVPLLARTPERSAVLAAVAARVPDPRSLGRPVLVAVDGVDGAGKSVLAAELVAVLRSAGRTVVAASVDGFHRPRDVRYRRGRTSPEGFWADSYDYDALRTELLDPFAPAGSRRFRRAVRDVATDTALDLAHETGSDDTVLVVDGIFLQRAELDAWWDVTVFLQVGFDETFRRMAARDGCPPDPADPANRRYVDGQLRYLAERDPAARADVLVDNSDVGRPVLLRG